ncbi:glycosyl transferase [Chryseobacterium manosquense]|uniref:Glycosyl transferase n=1 Tax=Chryseobacterium manosquense TaxID=2754694 RepID=A0A7H1DUG7_9FLAO|nr:glycosyltransferase [Chryseobacterium manosquense]QNS40625.1 glycosyl transferase [Chryseobacterium manosquense]
MIPKKIHYCWFGGKEKPESVKRCIRSWETHLPDYKIVEWNESNFNTSCCEFSKQAAQKEKLAFVSDVARIFALQKEGGIYFDTDVEVKNNFDEFLENPFFIGMETAENLCTAVIGSEQNHPFLQKILDHYFSLTVFKEITNNQIITNLLNEGYKFTPKDDFHNINNEIFVYPSHFFSLDIPKNYSVHYFIGTWHEAKENPYKEHLQLLYHTKELIKIPNAKRELNNIINNQKLLSEDDILDLVPFKNILHYSLKKLKSKIYKGYR